jgi:hypothetical protein
LFKIHKDKGRVHLENHPTGAAADTLKTPVEDLFNRLREPRTMDALGQHLLFGMLAGWTPDLNRNECGHSGL